jgi:single-stranded DNA-binding protein
MRQESYEKDGENRKVWRLIADRIEFLDSRKEDSGEVDPPRGLWRG